MTRNFKSRSRLLITSLLLAAAVPASGCNMFGNACNNMVHSSGVNDLMVGARNQVWARRAFNGCSDQLNCGSHEGAYEDGFIDGYCAVCDGGVSCMPAVPPQEYWSWQHRSSEGRAKTDAWFQGFPEGVRVAKQQGMDSMNQIPVADFVVPDYSQQVLPPVISQDSAPTDDRAIQDQNRLLLDTTRLRDISEPQDVDERQEIERKQDRLPLVDTKSEKADEKDVDSIEENHSNPSARPDSMQLQQPKAEQPTIPEPLESKPPASKPLPSPSTPPTTSPTTLKQPPSLPQQWPTVHSVPLDATFLPDAKPGVVVPPKKAAVPSTPAQAWNGAGNANIERLHETRQSDTAADLPPIVQPNKFEKEDFLKRADEPFEFGATAAKRLQTDT